MKKNQFALLTAILLSVSSCLTACGGGSESSDTTSQEIVTKHPESDREPTDTTAADTTAAPPVEPTEITVTSRQVSKTYTAPDGTELVQVSMTLPVVTGIPIAAEIGTFEQSILDRAAADIRMAEDMREVLPDPGMFMPYQYQVQYQLRCQSRAALSLTYRTEVDKGGAHSGVTLTAVTYDAVTGRALSLSDLTGAPEDRLRTGIAGVFRQLIDADPASYDNVSDEELQRLADPARFFLTDTGITFYMNEYDIAPYSVGIPFASLTYREAEAVFGCDLSRLIP